MDEPRRYPFEIDADALVDLISTCWRSHDGQWFLSFTVTREPLPDRPCRYVIRRSSRP